MATRIPTNPKNKLEKLICIADIDYLGHKDYLIISERLRREWNVIRKIKHAEEDWLDFQFNYLVTHKNYFQTAQTLRNAGKSLTS